MNTKNSLSNQAPKSINDMVKTAMNKLDNATEKVKDNLLQILSNEFEKATDREKRMMEGEMMLYIGAIFDELLSDERSKAEKAEYLKQYKLYSHLAKELNLQQALKLIKAHEEIRKGLEKKQAKEYKKQLKKEWKKKHKKSEKNIGNQQVSGDDNNTGHNRQSNIQGDGIYVNGNGNIVIIGGEGKTEQTAISESVVTPVVPEPIVTPTVPEPVEKPTVPEPVEKPVTPEPVEKPVTPEPETETEDYSFDLTASVSDVENIHQENAAYQAEEELKSSYHKLNRFNIFGKAKFFLMRGLMREKKIKKLMKEAKRSPFSDDQVLNSELGKGVNRQELETLFSKEPVDKQIKDIPEINNACISFIKGELSESGFQAFFTAIVKNKKSEFGIQNIEYLGTNILEKLKFEKAQFELVNELADKLHHGANTSNIAQKIEDFSKTYQKNPDFLKTIRPDLANKNSEKLKIYFKHESARRKIALENLKMNLNIFTNKKSAYQIDNSDREKGRAYELGKRIDQLPRWAQTAGFTGGGLLLGLTGGAIGLGVAGTSMLVTGGVAGMTGFKNYIKKWTHYTREQKTHEKNMTRGLSIENEKIQKRKNDTQLKGAKNWYRSYRAKRQLELYANATQSLTSTKDISTQLLSFGTSLKTPTTREITEIKEVLSDAKSRLEAYYKTGHNFLASEDISHIEEDMNELHMAIDMVCEKLDLDYQNIDSEEKIKNQISQYHHASSVFKKQRSQLAAKYGIATGLASAGVTVGTQYLMGTGMFSNEAVSGSTISKGQISEKEYFGLGSTDLGSTPNGGGQLHDGVKNAFDSLGNNTTVTIHYGAGTDATQVLPGSKFLDAGVYQDKLTEVVAEIDNLSLSKDQKLAFLKQLHDEPWKADWTKGFTSDYLHGQRCAEGLLETARGLANSGSSVVPDLSYDSAMNIAGNQVHQQSERFFNVNMEVFEHIPGKAGNGSSWRIPITGFANTVKKEPKKSDFSSFEEAQTSELTEEGINKEKADTIEIPHTEEEPTAPREAQNQQSSTPEAKEKDHKKSEADGSEASDSEPQKSRKKSIDEELAAIRKEKEEKEKKLKEENNKRYEEIYKKTGIDFRNSDKNKEKIVNLSDLDLKEFDFENKIYLTHHTNSSVVNSILNTGLRYGGGGLISTTNLAGKDNLLSQLEDAENGNHRHRNSDAVVIMEFDKKEFEIKPGEKSVIDLIGEKLMVDNHNTATELSVPPQYIKKVVKLDLKPKDLVSSITPNIEDKNQTSPTITPQVPESIEEKNLDDEKRREFTAMIQEYRALINQLDLPKNKERELHRKADLLFGDVFSIRADKKTPAERIQQYEDGITLLKQLKKEMENELKNKKG